MCAEHEEFPPRPTRLHFRFQIVSCCFRCLSVRVLLRQLLVQADDVPQAAALVRQKRYANPRAFETADVEQLLRNATILQMICRSAR